MPSFSERQGFARPPKEIIYREDLPIELRAPMAQILLEYNSSTALKNLVHEIFNPYGIDPPQALTLPIQALYGETADSIEFRRFLLYSPWYQVYEFIEENLEQLDFHEREFADDEDAARFAPLQTHLNNYFVSAGIGWQLINGKVVTRGEEAFETIIKTSVLELTSLPTTQMRIREALNDLSRRPKPDLTGAISHAFAAMESVVGSIEYTPEELRDQSNHTLGAYLRNHPELFPSEDFKEGLQRIWRYANNEGSRHGKEGIEPQRDEAEFIVTLAAALVTYLNRKHPL